jgi:hypothetical protein
MVAAVTTHPPNVGSSLNFELALILILALAMVMTINICGDQKNWCEKYVETKMKVNNDEVGYLLDLYTKLGQN